jgi:hypothetical protein
VQEVQLTGAAEALFGDGSLRPEQATYLDAVGNHNGVYDLGDFLAATDRAQTPWEGPAEMAAGTGRRR